MPTPCTNPSFRRLFFLVFAMIFANLPNAHAILRGVPAVATGGQVQIFMLSTSQPSFCTGTLISASWVLTADHCLKEDLDASGITIYLGNLQLDDGEAHIATAYVRNPSFDVAVIHLRDPATDNIYIRGYGIGLLADTIGTDTVTVQGWGATSAVQGAPPSDTLQTARMGVTSVENGLIQLAEVEGLPANGDSGAGVSDGGLVCGVESRSNLNLRTATATATDAISQWLLSTTGVTPAGACSPPSNQRPCESYSSNGVSCVAAYSTVRGLYSSFKGRLYQVTRGSDRGTADIGLASLGNYANAAAQDAFCANTTCSITKIYDQSPYGNDLSVEGPGGNGGQDSAAKADALPVMLGGHKVYGLSVTPGVGYRNDNTSGVARNVGPPPVKTTPEGMYMVTSGKNVNGACCFDFGNAETNNLDNHEGHMDALNFGTFCGFPPCSGSGPWVQADLENGQYMGGGSNPSNPANVSLPYNFVTAMLKNDSQSTFALRGGNAQSGSAVRLYVGSLPTQKPGYVPMQLEGAIVLGTGGDNSNGGVGSFFEGVMTSGYPTDAMEAAVQADIVAAGYSGNSSPTNGEAPTYTGPSDPNGPGPQDGLEGPADEQPSDLMGTKPGMAYYRGKIYAAFQSNDSRHELFVTSTVNGTPYPAATGYPDIHIGSAPAIAEFKHQLYVSFQADDASHKLFVTSSSTGADFPTATGYSNVLMGSAPGMVAFRHQLFVAFQANDLGHTLFVTASPDGRTFPTATPVPNVQIGSAPAMAVFRSQLFLAFRANDSSNDVWVASSADGYHFSSKRIAGPTDPQTMGPNSSPALVVSNNVLYCIYGAQDLANEMLVMASTDGVTWQGPKAYLDVQMGAAGPGASVTNDGFTVGFQSNDSRNVLFTSYKHTEGLAYSGPDDTGGPQDGFASPAVDQMPDVMGSKPAFTSVNNNILVAFQANDGTDDLFVASTQIGDPYPQATAYPNIKLGSAPAMLSASALPFTKEQRVFMAFQADDGTDDLFVTVSPDGGKTWPTATAVPNLKIGGAPAMAGTNGKLYLAFQADDGTHDLFITSSSDGQTWPTATAVPNVKVGSDPAIAILNGTIFVAFRADDDSNNVWIASSSDGIHFTSQLLPGQMGGNSSPALVATGNTLYYIYRANDLDGEMLVMASTDGTTWQGPEVYPGVQVGPSGPAASPYLFFITSPSPISKVGITVGFQSNDLFNILFTSTKTLK